MILLLGALYLGRQMFRGSLTTPGTIHDGVIIFFIHPTINLPMNNRMIHITYNCLQRYACFLRLFQVT